MTGFAVLPGRAQREPGTQSHDGSEPPERVARLDPGPALRASRDDGGVPATPLHIVGMENSAPSLTPDGQRAVTFFDLV